MLPITSMDVPKIYLSGIQTNQSTNYKPLKLSVNHAPFSSVEWVLSYKSDWDAILVLLLSHPHDPSLYVIVLSLESILTIDSD